MAVVVRDSNGKELKRFVQWGPANIDVLTITAVGAFKDGDTMVMVTTDNTADDGTRGVRVTMIDMGMPELAERVHALATKHLASNLAADEGVAQGKILRHAHHGLINGGVRVGVILAQDLADDTGALLVRSGSGQPEIVHGVEDASMDVLEPITHIGQGARDDHAHGVVHVGRGQFALNR